MTAKEYLMSLKKLDIMIRQKKENAEELWSEITSAGGFDYSKRLCVQTSASGDKMGDSVIRLLEVENEIRQMVVELYERKNKIINEIHCLENADHIRLLYMRYVEYMSLEEISVKMCFSYDRIRHMHGYALQEFRKNMKDDTK